MDKYTCELCKCVYESDDIYHIRTSDMVLRRVCKDCYYDKLRLTSEYYFSTSNEGKDGNIHHAAYFFETEKEVYEYISIFKSKYSDDSVIYISNSEGTTNVFLVDAYDYNKYKKLGTCNLKFKKFIKS